MADIKTGLRTREKQLQPLIFPKIIWHNEFLLAYIALIIEVIAFCFPQINQNLSARKPLLILFVSLLLMPFIIPILIWIVKSIVVMVKRIKLYTFVYREYEHWLHYSKQLNTNYCDLLYQFYKNKQFEITKILYFNNQLYMELKFKDNPRVSVDDIFVVINKQDDNLLGIFRVTEIRSSEIYAVAFDQIDAVFAGYVNEKQQINIFPNMRAYLKKEN